MASWHELVHVHVHILKSSIKCDVQAKILVLGRHLGIRQSPSTTELYQIFDQRALRRLPVKTKLSLEPSHAGKPPQDPSKTSPRAPEQEKRDGKLSSKR